MSGNEAASPAPPVMPKSSRLIAALAIIAMVSGLLVAMTFQVTAPRIALNKQRALEKAIFSVLPDASVHANFSAKDGALEPLPADAFAEANLFAGYDEEGRLVGIATEGSARGYQDVVRILYAYSPESECIVGITVLQSSETPGIGDQVESDPAFLQNFDCLDAKLDAEKSRLAHEIVTVKNGKKTQPWEIDGISGATITSVAIGAALNQSAQSMLPLVQANRDLLAAKEGADQ